jgi:glycosyltransferase involved in cell wall biosynthesis
MKMILRFLSYFKLKSFFSHKLVTLREHSDLSYLIAIAQDLAKIKLHSSRNFSNVKRNLSVIIWVVPPASVAGGGFRTISRFINQIESLGIQQEIHIYHPLNLVNKQEQVSIWNRNFGVSKHITIKKASNDNYKDALVIATGWQTMAHVISNTFESQRVLFMQDDETLFHSHGDLDLVIESLYKNFDIAITAGSWLKELAENRGIKKVISFGFGADQMFFSPKNLFQSRRQQIVFYVQPKKSWRASTILLAAVFELAKKMRGWRFVLVGDESLINIRTPRNVVCLGTLPPVSLAKLYAESRLGIVASMSNASLVPLEMIASGMKVLTNSGSNSNWIINNCAHIEFIEFSQDNLVNSISSSVSSNAPTVCHAVHVFDWYQEISPIMKFLIDELAKD